MSENVPDVERSVVSVEVLQPGLLTTVQDLGRPDAAALGAPVSGACDRLALSVANLLVGNDAGAAGLEMSLLGPELRFTRSATIALAGADFEATVVSGGVTRSLEVARAVGVEPGDVVRCGAAVDGARAYLAIAGGIDVPRVLGSASTCLSAGFGGLEGRALRAGDRLSVSDARGASGSGHASESGGDTDRWRGPGPTSGVSHSSEARLALRIVRGPHAALLDDGAWRAFLGQVWGIDPRSDRMGVRLTGADGGESDSLAPEGVELGRRAADAVDLAAHVHDGRTRAAAAAGGMPSLPMVWGAVELPAGGEPICLQADHPTVGGYPVVAVVITADLPLLAQLRPGHRVRFEVVELSEAQAALLRAEADLREGARRLERERGVGG